MIFPDLTPEEWLRKHPKLAMPETDCIDCGKMIKADKPYLEKGIVGFIALECPHCKQNHAVPRSMKLTDGQDWLS